MAQEVSGLVEKHQLIIRRSTVTGVVHALNDRGELRFMLYDALFDREIIGFVDEDQKDLLRTILGKRVIVTGEIGREPDTGNPVEIRNMETIEITSQPAPGQFEAAIGIITPEVEESPEETIRRMRDGK